MKQLGNKIVKIISLNEAKWDVQLKFSDGFKGWVSLKHIFEKPKGLAAEVLRGAMFDKCFVELGALAWPNGFELCPDALRQWLMTKKVRTKMKAA